MVDDCVADGRVIAGAIYGIAVPTMVTLLVPKEGRDKANGYWVLSWTIICGYFCR